ncbi:MAG: tetratricopeptide repeat protein [Helicobacteraceae bacterium]|nr:tetratricopeptide repeat protein [Helicobacteraceae bacterium]
MDTRKERNLLLIAAKIGAAKETAKLKSKIVGVIFAIFLCLLAFALSPCDSYANEVGLELQQQTAQAMKEQDPKKLFEQVDIAADNRDFQAAINLLSEVIAINPNNSNAYNYRGYMYYELQNYDQAIADYTKAIELDPDGRALYYNNRGFAYNELKNYKQAIADFTKAIALNPENAPAYYSRGNAYNKLKNYKQAIADFTKAIELDPNHSFAYNNRAVAHYELKNYNKARKDAKKACEIGDCEAWNLLNP